MVMKKIILLQLFLSISIFLAAQNFERIYQEKPMMFPQTILPLDDGNIMVGTRSGGYLGGWDSFRGSIFTLDTFGNIIDDINVMEFTTSSIEQIIRNGLEYYVIGNGENCDVFSNKSLMRINHTNGEVLWQKDLNYTFKSVMTMLGENILVASGNQYYLFSKFGEELTSNEIEIYSTDIIANSSDFIIVGKGGAVKDEVVYFDSLDFWGIEKMSEQSLFLLHKNGIIKTNNDLELIQTYDFGTENQFKEFKADDEFLYLFGNDTLGNTTFMVFDSTLNLQNQFLIGKDNLIPTDIQLKNGQVYLTGIFRNGEQNYYPDEDYLFYSDFWDAHTVLKNGSMWVKAFPKTSFQEITKPDIGVTNVEVDKIETRDSIFCGNTKFYNIRVTVKNFGTQPIDSFHLNSLHRRCIGLCESFFELYYHSPTTIQPSEELIVEFGDIDQTFMTVDEAFDFCFWTSNPNGLPDEDYSNNYLCETFSTTTSIKDFPFSQKIKLFPNPVNELLSVELPDEFVNEKVAFEIFNTQGQLVQQCFFNNKKTEQINIQNLAEGIYFLQIKKENGNLFSKRFAKIK